MKNKNIKLLLNYGLGPVLFVWLSWSIWQQVQNQPDLDGSFAKIKNSIGGDQSWKLFVCLFFVIVNWGLEARKWQILIRYIQPISFLKAFKATLAGLAFAMNTLNRIGEYGGRVVFVQDGLRWKAVSLTIIGSISQLIITLVFGIAGLFFVINHPSGDYDLWIKVLLSGTVFVTTGLIFLYFRFGFMIKLLARIPRTARFLQHVNVIENLPVRILLRVLLLSGIRYIVFVVQYILLLQLFSVDVSWWVSFWQVSVLYLVLAIVPTIALAELGLRGKVSLFLFSGYTKNAVGVAGAAAGIWGMNLVVPALAGSLLFLGIKIFSDK